MPTLPTLRRLRFAPLPFALLLCCASLTGCGTPTEPPIAPAVRIVIVYPALPSTDCPRPPDIPAFAGATDTDRLKAVTAWANSREGQDWLVALRKGAWECFDKLSAVHAQQMTWPAPTNQ